MMNELTRIICFALNLLSFIAGTTSIIATSGFWTSLFKLSVMFYLADDSNNWFSRRYFVLVLFHDRPNERNQQSSKFAVLWQNCLYKPCEKSG